MEKKLILELIGDLIKKQNITYEIMETDEEKFVMYYDDAKKKFYVNFKNLKKSADSFKISMEIFVNIVISHEIGHYIDLEKNREKYNKIYDKNENIFKNIMKNQMGSRDGENIMQNMNIELKQVEFEREKNAWDEGEKIINPTYVNQYLIVRRAAIQ